MALSKYGKLVINELKAPHGIMASLPEYERFGKRILWMDANVVEGAFQMNCSWYLAKNERSPEPHAHAADELIGFYGSDWKDPYNLGAEIEIWVDDQKIIIDRTSLVFVPAGVKHGPLWIRRVERPVIHFSVLTDREYVADSEGWKKLSSTARSLVVTELKVPPEKLALAEAYNRYACRVLWMDENVVPGSFHINTAWFFSRARAVENVPHTHDEDDEIIGFIGSDPNHPENLGAEVEIMLGDEPHVITKSSMIFVPAGLKHCPLILRRVDRPIFHFTTVPGKRYIKEDLA
jgi:hypothetical protein